MEAKVRLLSLRAAAGRRIQEGDWKRLEKAESFLSDWVCSGSDFDYGDQEALVYLASRGKPLSQQVQKVIKIWRQGEEYILCADTGPHEVFDISDSNGPIRSKKLRKRPSKTPEQRRALVRNILQKAREEHDRIARHFLGWRPFWQDGVAGEGLVISSTMLRAVEWCDIGGFDSWWAIWADDTGSAIVTNGIDGEYEDGAYWLFNICRSDLGIRLLGDALEMALRQLRTGGLASDKTGPWRIRSVGEHGGSSYRESINVAAGIVFAWQRLGCGGLDLDLVKRAADFLIQTQAHCGAWPWWADEAALSIQATAMAIHALALAKPKGWAHAMKPAIEWLWGQQRSDGVWYETRVWGSSVYQTVLVLDAIELATGGRQVTFRLTEEAVEKSSVPATGAGQKEDRSARTRRKPGCKPLSKEKAQYRREVLAKRVQASEASIHRKEFCEGEGITVKQLENFQTWARQRKNRGQ